MQGADRPAEGKPRSRLALVTAGCCFLLLLAGGLVHATGSGLACPDWPLCNGQVFPAMREGVLFEHGHRLIALTVAILTFALAISLWRRRAATRGATRAPASSRRLPWLATFAAILVVVQALLGALTVIWRLPTAVKTVHLGVSMAFFSLLLLIALRSNGARMVAVPAGARRFVGIAALAVYTQILIGALVRHTGSGLACSDLVLCGGELWPDWGPARLQMIHRMMALLVAALVIASSVLVSRSMRKSGDRPKHLRILASAPHGLVLLQIGLGMLSVRSFLGIATVTAHLGVGALLLADFVLLYLSLAPVVSAETDAPAWSASLKAHT